MSSDSKQHTDSDAGYSYPPGLHIVPSTSASYQPYGKAYDESPLSRLASLDLTSTRNTYDTDETWTELREFPPPGKDDSDTQELLEPRVRRSSTSSSASSTSTVARQSWAVRRLESMGNGIAVFCALPVIRHILWPLQWFDGAITRMMGRTRFHGWRMGILLGCCMSTIVLGINIAILVLGATREGGFKDGFAVPMSGVAEDVSWWSSAFHILINALSTLLLAASNYTMQVLSSPTRKDIDKAHARHEHLDIGVLSMRNLGRIPRRRLFLFILMGLSSIPIHLFYNSAVFYIGANNQYNLHAVQADWYVYNTTYLDNPAYDRIEGNGWIRLYDTALVSYGKLALVIDEYRDEIENKTLTGKPEGWPDVSEAQRREWVAGDVKWGNGYEIIIEPSDQMFLKNITATQSTSRDWVRIDRMVGRASNSNETDSDPPPKFGHVSHAYAQRLSTASRIQLSLNFLIIVIVCNTVKLLTMLWVVFMERKDYIVTLGDGASSFLERPDSTTEKMCILSKPEIVRDVADAPHKSKHNDQLSRLVTQSGKRWVKQYSTYSNALNRDREVGSYFIFIVVGILFALFLTTLTFAGKASTAWGTASDTTFRASDPSPEATLVNAWIANAGQLVLSFCYLAINSECTAMAGAAEWNNLATTRKGLRVTRPVGQQRDTYFLQLPYKWSLPLTFASGGLHWLLSQSVFLVRIDTYDRQGNLITGAMSKSACGFSGTSWMVMTICFWLLVGIVGLIGRKKIKIRVPFAASCSLVISAACHPEKGDLEPHMRAVRWGVVEEKMFEGERHCCLSSRGVGRPKEGEKYL
ncbi:hypothetical protein BKA63DRAFT_288711 [Paraphoma chrysanthemicola]|nr:hypothetical protein BKA63DRAFT_288711 [Paraphoma chrysanthemicola]